MCPGLARAESERGMGEEVLLDRLVRAEHQDALVDGDRRDPQHEGGPERELQGG